MWQEENMDYELKPCKKCGCTISTIKKQPEDNYYWIFCNKCLNGTKTYMTKEEAIAEWNDVLLKC